MLTIKCLFLSMLIIFLIYSFKNKEGFYSVIDIDGMPVLIQNNRFWYNNPFNYIYRRPMYNNFHEHVLSPWYMPLFLGPVDSRFCPIGCSNLGKGRWGCTAPGYDKNSCQFSADCAVCGY